MKKELKISAVSKVVSSSKGGVLTNNTKMLCIGFRSC